MNSELVKKIAMYRDNIGKHNPEIGTAIGDLLMLIVDAHYELVSELDYLRNLNKTPKKVRQKPS